MTQIYEARMPWPTPGCTLQHTTKTQGEWVRGQDEQFGLVVQGDGVVKHRMRCRPCGTWTGDLPRTVVKAWGLVEVEWILLNRPATYPPCTVRDCAEPGHDMHHFAPRNTFGQDADSWPVLPLCKPHHREWHTRMDGYRLHRKTPAEFAVRDGGCTGCGANFGKGHACFCNGVPA